jgi:hypothetical protein
VRSHEACVVGGDLAPQAVMVLCEQLEWYPRAVQQPHGQARGSRLVAACVQFMDERAEGYQPVSYV